VRFGDGHWHGTEALPLMRAPLAPVCAPALATRIRTPRDLDRETLLCSYRTDEWQAWFRAAGVEPPVVRGMVFDASLALAEAAAMGVGVALLPVDLFTRDLRNGRLVRLFDAQIDGGRYWLTRLASRKRSAAMRAFESWISDECETARDS
jgi:LysR family transcriptional regulator of beta-lactamase